MVKFRNYAINQLKAVADVIGSDAFIRLAAIKDRNGKIPADVTVSAQAKLFLTPHPVALIFYSTINREQGSEEEMKSLLNLLSTTSIKHTVFKNPTYNELEEEIIWATGTRYVSGILVAIMGHGSNGQVHLTD